jgi:general stress protein YciG
VQTNTRNRGFASMDPSRQRDIARKGGRAAHEKGTAHEFSPEEARAAGRKGGYSVSADRSHMSRIGRLGGKTSAGRRQSHTGGGSSHPGSESVESGESRSPEQADVQSQPGVREEARNPV